LVAFLGTYTKEQEFMTEPQFHQLSLNKSILRALSEEGYETPTPIQQQAIPALLAGDDLLATAQTGTGKTAAFCLPILQRLDETRSSGPRKLRVLILTPTRELALQIDASLRAYGRHLPFKSTVILGGVPSKPQIQALRRVPDILVATPGRLLDLYGQGYVRVSDIDMLVLDEADRMLDMGFVRDVRRIVSKLPTARQTMFFSATLTPEIATLASDMLRSPVRVTVSPPASVSAKIDQRVFFVEQERKRDLLASLLKEMKVKRALIFTRTKHRADRVMRTLKSAGFSADAIHSNKSQNARQKALQAFDKGQLAILVATDIVARGIDVEGISHVINFELPNDPESYVHRIGRTARAGAEGVALSFCNAEEVAYLQGIERLTKTPLTRVGDHEFHSPSIAAMHDLAGHRPGAASRPPRRTARLLFNGGARGGRR